MAMRAGIRSPFRGEARGGRGDVVDVDDAPLPAQALAVGASVAGRAAVVDVEHADPATREVGDLADAAPPTCAVGPPCTNTTYGGRSPSGARRVRVASAGSRTRARGRAAPRRSTARGCGIHSSPRRCPAGDALRLGGPCRRRRARVRRAIPAPAPDSSTRVPRTSSMTTFAVTSSGERVPAPSRVDHDHLVVAVRADRDDAAVLQRREPSRAREPRAARRCRRRRARRPRGRARPSSRTRQRFQRPVGSSM